MPRGRKFQRVSGSAAELYVDLPVKIKLWVGLASDEIRLHGYFLTSPRASDYGVSQTLKRLITSSIDRSINLAF